jgi:hypothetical protein
VDLTVEFLFRRSRVGDDDRFGGASGLGLLLDAADGFAAAAAASRIRALKAVSESAAM